jgi:acetoin utilization protein AcuB
MSTDLTTVHPLDTIEHAARQLSDRKIHCLPVVAEGELVGMITSSDMMHTLIELVGAHGPGSWVEVEVPNEAGMLAEVTDIIRDRHVNIASVFLLRNLHRAFWTHRTPPRTQVATPRSASMLSFVGRCVG